MKGITPEQFFSDNDSGIGFKSKEMEDLLGKFLNLKLAEINQEVADNIEYLQTTEEEEVKCISIENLTGILKRYGFKE